MEALYTELKPKGFVVLGFPSRDFGGQEFESNAEIKTFCTTKYKATFPIFERCGVKEGKEQHPVYANLQKQSKTLPEWNFGKYLVHKNGKVIKYYKAGTKPDNAELRKDIETALAQK